MSECFEGDPPFHARGCLSQATSVGGLLYISDLIGEWSKKSGKVVAEKKPAAKKATAKKAESKSAVAATEVESQSEEAKPKKKCVRKKK